MSSSFKTFNDAVHGTVEIPTIISKVIDHPAVQRLRNIKQLGGVYHVFPGASHNRFEHSIGVAHLGLRLARSLKERQPSLGITETDVLCVGLAGLCHDLGHGPFSHMFDRNFIPAVRLGSHWEHEVSSLAFVDLIFQDLAAVLRPTFSSQDLVFIKELITGSPLAEGAEGEGAELGPSPTKRARRGFRGRPPEMTFLCEIVANKRNGIDVDKLDYFLRDARSLGVPVDFDVARLISLCSVKSCGNEYQLAFPEKESWNVSQLFMTRAILHKRAYQHRVARAVELMHLEAMLLAERAGFLLPTAVGLVKISDTIDNPRAYLALTDHVFTQIQFSQDPALGPAREIMERISRRDLYPFAGECMLSLDEAVDEQALKHLLSSDGDGIGPEDVIVQVVKIDFGAGRDNPMDHVAFFSKDGLRVGPLENKNISVFLPSVFQERWLRVFVRTRKHKDAVRVNLQSWIDFRKE